MLLLWSVVVGCLLTVVLPIVVGCLLLLLFGVVVCCDVLFFRVLCGLV